MSGPSSKINSSFSDRDAAQVLGSSKLQLIKAAQIVDGSPLASSKAASIFDRAEILSSRVASILTQTDISVAKAGEILDHANLTAARLYSIFLSSNLVADRRVKFAHSWDRLGSKAPANSGDWESSPSNISNITDDSASSSSGSGYLKADPTETKIGYITIDIGSSELVRVLTLKYLGDESGTGTAYIRVERSTDGANWTTIVESFEEDTTFLINTQVRYVRFHLYARGQSSGYKYCTIDSCHFALG